MVAPASTIPRGVTAVLADPQGKEYFATAMKPISFGDLMGLTVHKDLKFVRFMSWREFCKRIVDGQAKA